MGEKEGQCYEEERSSWLAEELVEELVEEQVKEVSIVSIVLSLNWQEEEPRFYTEEEQEELDGI